MLEIQNGAGGDAADTPARDSEVLARETSEHRAGIHAVGT